MLLAAEVCISASPVHASAIFAGAPEQGMEMRQRPNLPALLLYFEFLAAGSSYMASRWPEEFGSILALTPAAGAVLEATLDPGPEPNAAIWTLFIGAGALGLYNVNELDSGRYSDGDRFQRNLMAWNILALAGGVLFAGSADDTDANGNGVSLGIGLVDGHSYISMSYRF